MDGCISASIDNNDEIYRIKLDGTTSEKVQIAEQTDPQFSVYESFIYYTSAKERATYSMPTSAATSSVKLCDGYVQPVIADGGVYYKGAIDGQLWTAKSDGTEQALLLAEQVDNVGYTGDAVFFTDASGYVCSVNLQGGGTHAA